MTLALTGQSVAVPQATAAASQQPASPLASLFTRYKRIDPQELINRTIGASATTGPASSGRQVLLDYLGFDVPANATDAQIAAAQYAAMYGSSGAAPATTAAYAAPAASTQGAQYVQPTVATYTAPATYTAAPVTTTTTAATTPRTAPATTATVATAATPATTQNPIAPRRAGDYWTAHIAQFRGSYLPDGPTMRPNCGPASVTIALRLIGLDIPGFNGERSEAVLDKARILATGRNDTTVGTTDTELERLIDASGARWSESNNLSEMLGWVRQGIPVILAGNPAYGWDSRYSSNQVYPFDGGHWVTVSGYDESSGFYVVNDPLSQIGPILVSESELRSYTNHHGGLGIAVFR